MEFSYLAWPLTLLILPGTLWGRVAGDRETTDRPAVVEKARPAKPVFETALLGRMDLPDRIAALEILRKPDFTFQTTTPPAKVRLATMEKLFDHPRLAAAMWRECQFAPRLYAFALPARGLLIDDTSGLQGTLTLACREAGKRVYLIEGRVANGRMGNPFAVGARMVVIYKSWEGAKGFQSQLQAWTTLDSALLGVLTRPFRQLRPAPARGVHGLHPGEHGPGRRLRRKQPRRFPGPHRAGGRPGGDPAVPPGVRETSLEF